MDPVDGPILASLLVGPCALEYTKMKTADHFWTDPSADELVQRHRIHSSHLRQDSPTKRPALCIQKRHSSGSMDDRPSLSARDYVESLHQNSRATLLYGKNNVLVQPRDDMEAVPGYLSLHQTADVMTLKWTPNQLMNGSMGDLDYEKRCEQNPVAVQFSTSRGDRRKETIVTLGDGHEVGVWGRASWLRLACKGLRRGCYSENPRVLGCPPRTFTPWALARLTLVQTSAGRSLRELLFQLPPVAARETEAQRGEGTDSV